MSFKDGFRFGFGFFAAYALFTIIGILTSAIIAALARGSVPGTI